MDIQKDNAMYMRILPRELLGITKNIQEIF